jgi:pimeloyl-ACP methyl ester carboxylesterase
MRDLFGSRGGGSVRVSVLAVGAAGLVAAAVAAAALAARYEARRLRSVPDPVALGDLLREPRGEDVFVQRPDGSRLRVRIAGAGPTVVLAHGIALNLGEWTQVSDLLLADGYRVVAFDARGHGRSTIGTQGISAPVMAADLLAVLEAADATDAIMVGHSMGGFLALEAILEVPGVASRLSGLVLVATFAGDILDGAPQNRAELPLLRSHLVSRLGDSPTIGTLFAATFFGPHPSPTMLAALLEMIQGRDLGPLVPLLEAFIAKDLLARLPRVDLPTVIVCGLADRTTPPRDSQRMAAAIPRARSLWVPGAGHMLPWEAPEAVRDAVATAADLAVAGR